MAFLSRVILENKSLASGFQKKSFSPDWWICNQWFFSWVCFKLTAAPPNGFSQVWVWEWRFFQEYVFNQRFLFSMWFPECVYVCDMCVIVVQIIYKINNLKLIQLASSLGFTGCFWYLYTKISLKDLLQNVSSILNHCSHEFKHINRAGEQVRLQQIN